ncbi:alpha/beta fold hydrolase [Crossiella cryophila]|uniref:Pimeloyl-ACP methyl ester carboxylesterase n=1 Tax=Crossiella cryophila TaxID=43355 RepID=A0A7W7CFU4_9PSEU|nr:alpha/beta hydrolase [Crossiella cryophila]MBB4680325.1 pimeloyl-ACP methyl ester carboxylesterase [Crossiella cryophila]
MSIIDVSPGVSIAYETFGDPGDAPILLVMGFGAQLLSWEADFCRELAGRGRYVIRYDNRDCGLSTRFDDHPVDMAADGLGLLTALGIDRAHVFGASMGGMIAQTMAITSPDRVLTLTSMMSSTGEKEYGQPTPEARAVLFSPRPAEREAHIAAAERDLVWASRRHGDAALLRAKAAEAYDRAYYPAGVGRQLGAMILSGSRAADLAKLQVPTLVIHGLDDTLIDPSGGRRTAELVPGAELLLIPDMGHDRPRVLWPRIIDAVAAHTG